MTPEQETIDDQSLFDGAVSNEPAEPVIAEQHLEEPAAPSQPRDEAGRFAAKQDEEPLVADPAARPQVDDNAPQVPSWRVREINEEKRALAAELEALRAERVQWARQQQQPPAAPKVEQPQAERPDPLLDPEGYAKHVREEIRQELIAERRETSLQNAAAKYKEEFGEAYQAAQKNMNPALRAMMHESRDPGETLIKWHREQKTKAEIGDDLGAYKQRLRDELLKDAEFRKQAMEAWRAGASPAPADGRPRVELAPSLNSVSRSHALLKPEENLSDQQLFESIAG